MSEQAPTYTTEEGTVGYIILGTGPDHDHEPIVTGIKYDTMAEAIKEIERLKTVTGQRHGDELRVFEVMGIDREEVTA